VAMILVSLDDGSSIALTKAVMFFGRGHECDFILGQSRKVSRKHCCVAQIDDGYLVRDLGSMNGVRVNALKAEPELPLKVGDELWIGDVGFQFLPAASNGMPVQLPKEKVPAEAIPEEEEPEEIIQVQEEKLINAPLPSMEFPVAIPEEGQDLVIEESIKQKVIDLDQDEVVEQG